MEIGVFYGYMIDKIVVHEAIMYENGFSEQKIEIYYRFVGKID